MHFGFFPSFFDKPANISFEHQEVDESIELFLRQHWIVNIAWIFIAAAGVFLPPVLLKLDQMFNTNFFLQIPLQISTGGFIVWYMLLAAFVIENFLSWYFNIYIVTNMHLVDINFHSLISRDITEVETKDVQSQSAHRKGVLGALFDFGDVFIETAAERQRIEFRNVPKPDLVADRIQDLGKK